MTLQQLRYIIKVAETGSIHTAANELFIAQPSLSKSIMELEKEMNIIILNRTNRGVSLTENGLNFLSYAKQVVEQADILESKYKENIKIKKYFAISSQHYSFIVHAFKKFIKQFTDDEYEFYLRELKTQEIIEDVTNKRSEIGILYLSNFNKELLSRHFHSNDLKFVELFKARPHVLICKNHPLSKKSKIKLSELTEYPLLKYDQGINHSFFYAEELHSIELNCKNIIVSDRATLVNLLVGLDGYTISSGIFSKNLIGDNIVAIPLDSDEVMSIGYIHKKEQSTTLICQNFLQILKKYIKDINTTD